jgi:MerR family transcriptional regulator, light-induced transcriptional regulator
MPDVSLRDAAELLGVHYMTAYRYVRLGLLPARKAGGAWLVAEGDVTRFVEGRDEAAGARRRGRQRARGDDPERLAARLLAGDRRGSLQVVEAALLHLGYKDLIVEVMAPALREVGDRWWTGQIDVADEHRATEISLELLYQVGNRFIRRGRKRGVVVIGCAPGERHSMPAALVASAVRSNGFSVDWLGADVPATSFVVGARSHPDLVAVGVSVTSTALAGSIPTVVSVLREAGITAPVIVGGAGIDGEDHARALAADAQASDARAAVEVLDGLPLSRGRPR